MFSTDFADRVEPPRWPQMKNRKLALTQPGRTAIALFGEATGLKVGDDVLMSANNCGSELDALLAARLRVRYVDCDEQGFVFSKGLEKQVGRGAG